MKNQNLRKFFYLKFRGSVIHTIHERINLLLTSKLDKLKIHFCLLKFFFLLTNFFSSKKIKIQKGQIISKNSQAK